MIASQISIPIAFVAGMTSFFAPCVVPLLPVYISYVTGVSLKELKEKGYSQYRRKLLFSSLFYILGFSLVFTLLGIGAAGLGVFFRRNMDAVQVIGGVLMILFGLEIAGFLRASFLQKNRSLSLPKWVGKAGHLRSFALGIIFAFTWTPCVGPILGGILALAAVSGSALSGGILLFVYSLGISSLFLVVSFGLVSSPKLLKKITNQTRKISMGMGVILIVLGVLLATGTYSVIFSIASRLGLGLR